MLSKWPICQIHVTKYPVLSRRYPMNHAIRTDDAINLSICFIMVTVSTVDSKLFVHLHLKYLLIFIVEIINEGNLIKCKIEKYSTRKEAVQLSYSNDNVNAMVEKKNIIIHFHLITCLNVIHINLIVKQHFHYNKKRICIVQCHYCDISF